jgi:mono/diheme cytochrome c family protein
MFQSLAALYLQPHGVNNDADLDSKQAKLPLRHAGVTCAVCHVRNGNRFGPPRKNDKTLGHIKTDAHGGFTAKKEFEQSNFCAECHQFPQSFAINGKPLENTVFEWQQSTFAKQGKQCQSCHMPDRTHSFKGIHDKTFTRQGLDIQTSIKDGAAQLNITSTNIGHAFPTYVTPKIIIQAKALDKQGKTLKTWQWEIVREVQFTDAWEEKKDTRLMPGESRVYVVKQPPKESDSIVFDVKVIPDHFYKGVYESLLSYKQHQGAKLLIERALDEAQQNDYTLFSEVVTFPYAPSSPCIIAGIE